MLTRVLEPEVMDTLDEALDYDRMNHTEVNRVFAADLIAAAPELLNEDDDAPWVEILDLGTGTALIPIELCRRAPRGRVVAVDLAVSMLNLARGNIEVANLTERIRPDLVDAKRLPYPDGMFGIVMSNTIVHHIPEPGAVMAEASRATAPGGLLFIRDLLRPADDATVTRLVDTYVADGNERQRQLFDQSLRAALTLDEVRAMCRELGLPAEAVAQTSDRHWTLAARL